MKKMTNKEYLESILSSKKLELKEVEIKHRIFVAEIEKEKDMLRKQIDSIELQLNNNEGD